MKTKHSSKVLGAAIVLLAMSMLLLGMGTASADTFGTGTDGSGLLPDDATHSFCWGSNFTSTSFRNAASGRMANLDNQTSMSDSFVSCSSLTDVRFELMSGSNGVRGDWTCLDWVGQVCYSARIRMNTTYLTNDINRRKTACHEIGHSVGFSHLAPQTDCMVSGAVSVETATYNTHHRTHINDYIACLSNPICSG